MIDTIPWNLRDHPKRGVIPKDIVFHAAAVGLEGGLRSYCDTARHQAEAAAIAAYLLGYNVEVTTRPGEGGDDYVVRITTEEPAA